MLTRTCTHQQHVGHIRPVLQQVHCSKLRSLPIAKADMGAGALWLSAAAMGVGAYGSGSLALISKRNKGSDNNENPSYMPALSAGLLMGAALAIVVPEGFRLQASLADDSSVLPEWASGAALLLGFLAMVGLQVWADWDVQAHGGLHSYTHTHCHGASPPATAAAVQKPLLSESAHDPAAGAEEGTFAAMASISAGAGSHTGPNARGSHARSSLEDLSIESQIAGSRHRHSLEQQAAPRTLVAAARRGSTSGEGTADEKEGLLQQDCSRDVESLGQGAEGVDQGAGGQVAAGSTKGHHSSSSGDGGSSSRLARPDQALVGLVAHSVADGLAVGAASLAGDLSVGLTVAMAIVLHKLPVAWSLASFLRVSQGIGKAHKGLLIFSAAAPVAAIAVHYLFSSITWLTHPQTVLLCILASAGSVLHAGAVHVLPEVPPGPRWQGVMCAAALIPLLISMIPDD